MTDRNQLKPTKQQAKDALDKARSYWRDLAEKLRHSIALHGVCAQKKCFSASLPYLRLRLEFTLSLSVCHLPKLSFLLQHRFHALLSITNAALEKW